jgi:hypothetical protein
MIVGKHILYSNVLVRSCSDEPFAGVNVKFASGGGLGTTGQWDAKNSMYTIRKFGHAHIMLCYGALNIKILY